MRRHLAIALFLAAGAWGPLPGAEGGWMFRPGHYSHDPVSGARVAQFERPPVATIPHDPTYLKSGYRQKQARLRGAGSSDNRHIVETWGEGANIRPYGEWLFPYRAGATPYGPWGNPQGPWTRPYDSWVNPYGSWNRYPAYGPGPYRPYPGGSPPVSTPYGPAAPGGGP